MGSRKPARLEAVLDRCECGRTKYRVAKHCGSCAARIRMRDRRIVDLTAGQPSSYSDAAQPDKPH